VVRETPALGEQDSRGGRGNKDLWGRSGEVVRRWGGEHGHSGTPSVDADGTGGLFSGQGKSGLV